MTDNREKKNPGQSNLDPNRPQQGGGMSGQGSQTGQGRPGGSGNQPGQPNQPGQNRPKDGMGDPKNENPGRKAESRTPLDEDEDDATGFDRGTGQKRRDSIDDY